MLFPDCGLSSFLVSVILSTVYQKLLAITWRDMPGLGDRNFTLAIPSNFTGPDHKKILDTL